VRKKIQETNTRGEVTSNARKQRVVESIEEHNEEKVEITGSLTKSFKKNFITLISS